MLPKPAQGLMSRRPVDGILGIEARTSGWPPRAPLFLGTVSYPDSRMPPLFFGPAPLKTHRTGAGHGRGRIDKALCLEMNQRCQLCLREVRGEARPCRRRSRTLAFAGFDTTLPLPDQALLWYFFPFGDFTRGLEAREPKVESQWKLLPSFTTHRCVHNRTSFPRFLYPSPQPFFRSSISRRSSIGQNTPMADMQMSLAPSGRWTPPPLSKKANLRGSQLAAGSLWGAFGGVTPLVI